MTVSELDKLYGQPGVQVRGVVMYITSDGIDELAHGFVVSTSDMNGQAVDVYRDTHKVVPMTDDMKIWDDVLDALFPGKQDSTARKSIK